MPLLRRKAVLAAKVETTIGTAISLSASDATMNVYDTKFSYSVPMETREGQGGFNYIASPTGGHSATISFKTDLAYDGSTEPTWATTFLPACGWVANTGVYYPTTAAPTASGGVKTLTMACYQDGKVKKISGAMGSWTLQAPTGRPAVMEWTFTGKVEDEADTAILTPTPSTTKGSRVAGGTFTWNSVSMCAENTTVESGNTVSPLECIVPTQGFSYFYVSDRRPMVKTNPPAELVATIDRWDKWRDLAEHSLALTIPGVAGGSITFTAAKAQIVNMQEGDRNGVLSDELEFQCNKNGSSADQELTITFTAAS